MEYYAARNMEDSIIQGQGEQTPKKSSGGGFFSFFGKLVFFLVIISGLLYGGYYLGKNQISPQKLVFTPSSTQTPAALVASPVAVTTSPSPLPPRIVKAGLTTSSFGAYKVTVSGGWVSEETPDETNGTDVLTISQGDYKIMITQNAGSAGNCIFPGDTNTSGMGAVFDNFVGFTGTTSKDLFKRGTQNNGLSYDICQLIGGTNYKIPTSYGYITYSVPAKADPAILNQMGGIVASITR